MSELKLEILAYNYLVRHIFENQERLEKVSNETVRKECLQRIEVYEYLIKKIGGDVRDVR